MSCDGAKIGIISETSKKSGGKVAKSVARESRSPVLLFHSCTIRHPIFIQFPSNSHPIALQSYSNRNPAVTQFSSNRAPIALYPCSDSSPLPLHFLSDSELERG